jgi:hypothetical protein
MLLRWLDAHTHEKIGTIVACYYFKYSLLFHSGKRDRPARQGFRCHGWFNITISFNAIRECRSA